MRSDRHHIAVRARSSLARHSGKAATLKALKKLKGCLCATPPEEQLPLFQIHCTDFRRSMDGARAQVGPRAIHSKLCVLPSLRIWIYEQCFALLLKPFQTGWRINVSRPGLCMSNCCT